MKKSIIPTSQALTKKECEALLLELGPSWFFSDDKTIKKNFKFPDFMQGVSFINAIAELAEQERHHPDLLLSWGRVDVSLSTHSVNGLSKKDFSLAEKIDALYIAQTLHD